jgi:hypothetical protein
MGSGTIVEPTPAVQQYPTNYGSAQTDAVLWTPASGKKIVLFGVFFSTDTAGNFFLEVGGASTKVIPAVYVPANGTIVINSGSFPLWVGAADQTLTYTSSMSGNNSIKVWGEEI